MTTKKEEKSPLERLELWLSQGHGLRDAARFVGIEYDAAAELLGNSKVADDLCRSTLKVAAQAALKDGITNLRALADSGITEADEVRLAASKALLHFYLESRKILGRETSNKDEKSITVKNTGQQELWVFAKPK